jgi:hypothetical protein
MLDAALAATVASSWFDQDCADPSNTASVLSGVRVVPATSTRRHDARLTERKPAVTSCSTPELGGSQAVAPTSRPRRTKVQVSDVAISVIRGQPCARVPARPRTTTPRPPRSSRAEGGARRSFAWGSSIGVITRFLPEPLFVTDSSFFGQPLRSGSRMISLLVARQFQRSSVGVTTNAG